MSQAVNLAVSLLFSFLFSLCILSTIGRTSHHSLGYDHSITSSSSSSSSESRTVQQRRLPLGSSSFTRDGVKKEPANYLTIEIIKLESIFLMAFDTGSASLWVPSTSCGDTACSLCSKYDSSESTSYRRDGRKFSAKGGDLRGYVSEDVIWFLDFGPGVMVRVEGQKFAEVTHEAGPPPPGGFCIQDGVVGLAFPRLSPPIPGGMKPFFNQLVDQGKVTERVFAFWVGSTSMLGSWGALTLGGLNESHFIPPLHYVPVIPQVGYGSGYWQVKLDAVLEGDVHGLEGVNGDFVGLAPSLDRATASSGVLACREGCRLNVDTGSELIKGSEDEIAEIQKFIGAKPSSRYPGRYEVDCDTIGSLPAVVFVIGGRNYSLGGDEYVIVSESEERKTFCLSGFVGLPASMVDQQAGKSKYAPWVLGNLFLKRYYTVFDMGQTRIGFALAIKDKGVRVHGDFKGDDC